MTLKSEQNIYDILYIHKNKLGTCERGEVNSGKTRVQVDLL